nr:39S ribosomal protein L4, mitochondrial-like isoform X2 [Ciona intestinalis]XP_018668162.1 39S ribosomal protein L4, mitochondrial-like isoform X2 [Ciona intestinalis]|eukprot:XP_002122114.1 39S ribosomal protein L4, mitochondrial-like isoform X2 [Ciona intestinalis]
MKLCCRKLISPARFILQSIQSRNSHVNREDFIPPNLVMAKVNPLLHNVTIQEVPKISDKIPVFRHCVEKLPKNKNAISVWLDNLLHARPQYNSVVQLHPVLFDTHPRMDILHSVVRWQQEYREVDYSWSRTRAEIGRGKKKPWPQKGTGRARHGSSNSPLWVKGGISQGPRGPRASFYELNPNTLLDGLLIALSIKHIQNDLIIIESAQISQDMPDFDEYLENRNLSEASMLLVHAENENISYLEHLAEDSKLLNIMPLYGLNVCSILKHDKLVLSRCILDELEHKVLWHKTRYPWLGSPHNFYIDMPGQDNKQSVDTNTSEPIGETGHM